jgi:hypothetical protein
MLLHGYTKEMFRPKCNPGFLSVHFVAHLDEYVSVVLPRSVRRRLRRT